MKDTLSFLEVAPAALWPFSFVPFTHASYIAIQAKSQLQTCQHHQESLSDRLNLVLCSNVR